MSEPNIPINLVGPRKDNGDVPIFEIGVPTLPRVGDHVDYEPGRMSGYVKSVSFWWDEHNNLTIEVRVS